MIKKMDRAFEIYEKFLRGKKLHIECDDGTEIICIFNKENFKHLTGVEYPSNKTINSKQFYDLYKKNKLNKNKLKFDDYSKMKLEVFPNLQLEVG